MEREPLGPRSFYPGLPARISMTEFFVALCVGCVALFALAGAIRYFWRLDARRSYGYAGFVLLVFCVFWLSGVWEGAGRQSLGELTPVFFLIILCSAAVVLPLLRVLRKAGVFSRKDK